jgi:hypothetical protein
MPGGGGRGGGAASIGENPPAGASIWYHLKEKPKGDVTIEILDAAGKSVKKFSSRAPEAQADKAARPVMKKAAGASVAAPRACPPKKA